MGVGSERFSRRISKERLERRRGGGREVRKGRREEEGEREERSRSSG